MNLSSQATEENRKIKKKKYKKSEEEMKMTNNTNTTKDLTMTVKRERLVGGTSRWNVNFGHDRLAKIASKNDGRTYNPNETFAVKMGIAKNGKSEGFVKNETTGKEIAYTAQVLKSGSNRKYVEFTTNDGQVLGYSFPKNFRGLTTGAFYRFFTDAITKLAALSTVTVA